jgi:hypothetical protein
MPTSWLDSSTATILPSGMMATRMGTVEPASVPLLQPALPRRAAPMRRRRSSRSPDDQKCTASDLASTDTRTSMLRTYCSRRMSVHRDTVSSHLVSYSRKKVGRWILTSDATEPASTQNDTNSLHSSVLSPLTSICRNRSISSLVTTTPCPGSTAA